LVSITHWYVRNNARRAFLLSDGSIDRKLWLDHRLKDLAGIFALAVRGFSILESHVHALVRPDPDTANGWSDEEVVQRWSRHFPPRDK
jgi:hypothetical protein